MTTSTIRASVIGGLVPALALFATDLGYGWIAFSPLGDSYAHTGIVAAFLAAAIGSIVPGLIGGTSPLLASARPAQTLIFASMLAELARAGGGNDDPFRFLLAGATCVALAGVFMMTMGRVGLGRAIKYTPMPVLAGFTNGVALSMALSAGQMILFGQDHGGHGIDGTDLAGRAGFIVLLLAVMFFSSRFSGLLHWSLVGLLVGMAGFHGAAWLGLGGSLGGTLPDVSGFKPDLPLLTGHAVWLSDSQWLMDLSSIIPAAFTISVLNALETLVIASQQDLHDGTRHDSDRVLIGQGLANVLGGLLGALPSAPSNSRYRVSRQLGGRTNATSITFGLTMLGLLWLAPRISGDIPTVALAAILIYMAFTIVDDWAKSQIKTWFDGSKVHSIRREMAGNLGIMFTVMLIAVLVNLVAAMAVGIVTAMFLFVRRHSRSIVARVYRGNHRHSSVMRPASHERTLVEHGAEIVLIELDGPLFFGSGDSLIDAVEELSASARHIVLDFRQVDNLESSGAAAIQRITRSLNQQGIHLYIASIDADSPRARLIRAAGIEDHMPAGCWYHDVDHALEAAEDNLLQANGLDAGSAVICRWEEMDTLSGLDTNQVETFKNYGRSIHFREGDFLFHRGDPGDTLYLLLEGRVEIQMAMSRADANHRLVALRPGTVFGELALLKGGIRTADAVVSTPTAELLALRGDDLENLLRDQPDVAILFFRNIARLMATRIATTSDDLRYALSGRD